MGINDWVSIVSAIAALISATAAVFWGRGLATAKDETIRTKEAQIDALCSLQEETLKAKDAQMSALESQVRSYRELTPMKLREYFSSVKAQMEEHIQNLEEKLVASQTAINEKDAEISQLKVDGDVKATELEQLEAESSHLKREQNWLRQQLKTYQETEGAITVLEGAFGRFTRVWNEEQGGWQIKLSMGHVVVIGSDSYIPSA